MESLRKILFVGSYLMPNSRVLNTVALDVRARKKQCFRVFLFELVIVKHHPNLFQMIFFR